MRPSRRLLRDWTRVNLGGQLAIWIGAVLLFHAIDAFENLREYTRYGATAGEIAVLYLMRTPEIALQILPAALLLGSMIAMFRLARAKELTAAEASGLHPGWIYAVPLGLALAWSALGVAMEAGPLPRSRAAADRFLALQIEGNPLQLAESVRWRLADDALWRIEQPDMERRRYHVERYRRSAAGLEVWRWRDAVPVGDAWRFDAVDRVAFAPLRSGFDGEPPALPFLPEELVAKGGGGTLPLGEAIGQARRKAQLTGEVSQVELDVHQRLSWALLNLTALAAALPFVPRHGRKASAAIGVLIALMVGVAGWATVVMGSAYATSERVVAAFWLPHGLFLLTALAASTRIWERLRR